MGEFEDQSQQAGGGIFPFLSVLCCVIGTMILILIAGSLNAAGFINVTELQETIMAKRSSHEESLAELGRKERDLVQLREERDVVAKQTVDLDNLAALRNKKLNVEAQREETMGRTANIKTETARIMAIPRNKELMDEQSAAESKRILALAEKATSEEDVAAAKARRAELDAERRKLESKVNALKAKVSITGEGIEGEAFLIELAPDLVKVHSEGLPIAKGTEENEAGAKGDGGLLERLAMELARPGTKRAAVLLIRPGAIELYNEAERRLRRRRVPLAREPVEAGWEIAPE